LKFVKEISFATTSYKEEFTTLEKRKNPVLDVLAAVCYAGFMGTAIDDFRGIKTSWKATDI